MKTGAAAREFLTDCREEGLAWARQVLGVPEDASPEEAREIAMERLAAKEFVPPADEEQAIALLASQAAEPLAREEGIMLCRRGLEEQWRPEVKRFVEEFFQTAPHERRQRWLRLAARCRCSAPLTVRLEALEPGLDFEPVDLGREDRFVQVLAAHLQKTFVLPLHQREAEHAELLRNAEKGPKAWRVAAIRLRQKYPSVAGLDPDFVNLLVDLARHLSERRKEKRNQERDARRAAKQAARQSRQSAGSGVDGGWWVIAFCLIVLSNALRSCESGSKSSSPGDWRPPDVRHAVPRAGGNQPPYGPLPQAGEEPNPWLRELPKLPEGTETAPENRGVMRPREPAKGPPMPELSLPGDPLRPVRPATP